MKNEFILHKKMNYPEGLMTKQQWLNYWRIRGATVEETQEPKINFSRSKYNKMNGWEQQEYEKKLKETKIAYRLNIPNSSQFYSITKIEYEYFKNCELAEDLKTEKSTIGDREAMEKEFEFAKKYFK